MFWNAESPPDEASQDDDEWVPPIPDAVDLVIETQSVMSVLAAQQYARVDAMRGELLADAAANGYAHTDVVERSIRLELALAMGMTEAAADMLLAHAEALVHRYPAALDSLGGARMTAGHANALVDALDAVEPELRDDLLPALVLLAETQPVGTFRRRMRVLIETARVTTLPERYGRAVLDRRVILENADDAMAWLHVFLPAVEAHAIHGRATAVAKVLAAQPDEHRTLDQLRADVLGDLLIDGTTEHTPVEARGIRATVAVTVPALALLDPDDGVGEQAVGAHSCTGGGYASVEGVGPIPMDRARELCGGTDGWMRILTHPETGMVLSVGRDRYRPPPSLRRLVRWRADACMAPGCSIPAARCQIDHNVAWEHGGQTALTNLTPFCQGHHTVKHHGGWKIDHIPDSGGAVRWTSPTGRLYRVDPERKVPSFALADDLEPPPF
ncbi:DUF222 domain-containing protein [Microbacterium sp. P01]|uniref:HNH endonuclease signature motif containing protein n=1 Tax=Microbacterium sp. P01 TaxID=3366261 RepID=UPI00366C00A3